jgi:L-ascorbate metabolism protein UlaG (beta-lactamase superfamily)
MPGMGTTLDWYGCATFRLTIGRLVVFLDAYIDRAPSAPGTGLRADDIDRADWVVVGHSHFDHLWGAERIALATGATVIGSYESTRILAHHGVPEPQLISVSGGERVRLADDVTLAVFPSLHSCVWSHTSMGASDAVCLGDLGLTYQEREARMGNLMRHFSTLADDIRQHLAASQQGARGDGGALVYVFETPDGSLLYQDTSGHWSGVLHDLRPDVAILAAAGPRQRRRRTRAGDARPVRRPAGVAAQGQSRHPRPPRRLAAGVLDRDRRRAHPHRDLAVAARRRPR